MKQLIYILSLAAVLFSCSVHENPSDAYGNFEADDIIVSSEVNGKILKLDIEEGKIVEKGKQVGVIDTINFVLKREQLVAQKKSIASKIESISAQIKVLEQQKKNLIIDKKRLEKLFNDGAATKKQLDDINGKIDLVNAQISSVETQNIQVHSEIAVVNAQIEEIQQNIDKCKIINPLTGTVLEKYAGEGEITAFGKPLYKIADLSFLNLKVYVSGAQLPGVKIGQETEVLIDKSKTENRSLKGKVVWISSNAEFTPKIIQTKEERVNMVYAVKIRVKNDGSLKIGMPGEANFK